MTLLGRGYGGPSTGYAVYVIRVDGYVGNKLPTLPDDVGRFDWRFAMRKLKYVVVLSMAWCVWGCASAKPRRVCTILSAAPSGAEELVVLWGDERLALTPVYNKQILVETICQTDVQPDGLAFDPAGRLAVSEGHGTHEEMFISYLRRGARDVDVVTLRETPKGVGRGRKRELEKEGYFWFFGGQLAFDRAGDCHFTLGSCGGNGIYKVLSANPANVQRVVDLKYGSQSLQIPYFDSEHYYVSMGSGIYRIPIAEAGKAPAREPWWRIVQTDVRCYHAVFLNPDELLVNLGKGPESWRNQRMLYCNRKRREYAWFDVGRWSNVEGLRAMTIDFTGERLVGYDRLAKSLVRLELK